MEYPPPPPTAMIQSESGGGNCQPDYYEIFAVEGSGGDKEKARNDITVEFRG